MNGRVFAASHSNPVLWNDSMPAAAAAAISPAPYARCFDASAAAGTGFPYFGALYNNSLPPTAYRLQAGCMPNLGQFWPPTPPPDGCGRFDGSNLYFGPPVLRHTENISSNIRSSFQGLGHYPHLVETPKEQNQRMFKRETPVSPNVSVPSVTYSSAGSKSDNYNSCCGDSKLKPQNSVAYSLPPKHDLLTVSSGGHESYLSDGRSSSSSLHHPSTTDKSCMSPSLKNNNNNYHCSPHHQDAHHQRAKPANQENASPLKNVYFSHFESENVVSHCNGGGKNLGGGASSLSKARHHHPYHLGGYVPDRQEYNNGTSKGDGGIVLIKEQQPKPPRNSSSSSFKVKHEKKDHTDCKYQKSSGLEYSSNNKSSGLEYSSNKSSGLEYSSNNKCSGLEYNNNKSSGLEYSNGKTSDAFVGIPTSLPKLEPSDKYFLPSCSSAGYRYAVYQPPPADYQTAFHGSCSLAKPSWPQYSELPSIGLENYFRSPEVSIAQTAPQEVKGSTAGGGRAPGLAPRRTPRPPADLDDEVQIIGVQNKHTTSKHESRHSNEKAREQAPVLTVEPLCLKSEKDESVKSNGIKSVSQAEPLSFPSLEKMMPVERLKSPGRENTSQSSKSSTDVSSASDSPLKNVSVKKEHPAESPGPESHLSSRLSPAEIKANNCDNSEKFDAPPAMIKPEESAVRGAESDFCVNHGLNLIVKSIERIAFLEKTDKKTKTPDITADSRDRSPAGRPRGLDLLSVIAGQRLMSDFNQMKREPDDEDKSDESLLLKSNYPEEKSLASDNRVKPKSEAACKAFKSSSSSVFEMQNRLAELKKKYKQKQKELSRLKPKKRFANAYLKGRQKAAQESCETSVSSGTCDSLNSSFCSSVSTDQDLQNSKSSNEMSQSDSKGSEASSRKKLKRHIKKEPLNPSEQLDKRVTRRSAVGKSAVFSELSEKSRNIKKSLRSKASHRLRRSIELSLSQMNGASRSKSRRKSSKNNSDSLPEENASKVYSLRHSSQSSGSRKRESKDADSASSSKTLSSKRKSDNPKKYMPSKQSKLSETIIAKQLRNRILFDTSCATSDDENFKDGVPDDLYDAMMNCHLQEPKNGSKLLNYTSDDALDSKPLSFPEPSKLKDEHLIENQRLLALEDGLFYAGYVKEYHSSKKYGIALDGQRGNRLHMFTREEMLTQTIVESKPLTSELPEGTRVCAYWSQQYRCLYPGVVGKAPCPSADWSEPRVFVLFDDGDSGQIPTKNIRLIPPDIISAETAWKSSTETVSSRMESRGSSRSRSKRLKCSTPTVSSSKHRDAAVNETESKESSCGSPNESSCDDSCFNDLSPSHPAAAETRPKSKRKRSKRRTSSRRGDEDDGKRRHKRVKHRRRHHHHHRHHHRHHHHHHSKKHKHRRKSAEHSDPVAAANLPQGGDAPLAGC